MKEQFILWEMQLKTRFGLLYSWEHKKIPRKKKKAYKKALVESINSMSNEEFKEFAN